jgi:hypothetical protein
MQAATRLIYTGFGGEKTGHISSPVRGLFIREHHKKGKQAQIEKGQIFVLRKRSIFSSSDR